MRILIVSENEVLLRNFKEWFDRQIRGGSLIVDHAFDKKEATEFLKHNTYDKVFHNGIYIIDAVERYQQGSDIWNFGTMRNNYQNVINFDDKRSFSRIINKKYLQSGVNIGGAFAILSVLVGIITWGVNLRADVNVNEKDIGDIKETVSEIRVDQKEDSKNLNELKTAFEIVYKDEMEKARRKNLDK